MADTIELLEMIGRDASLHAMSVEQLSLTLVRLQASHNLKHAVASGDRQPLYDELGLEASQAIQVQTQGGYEDEGEDDDDDGDDANPDGVGGRMPVAPGP